ncbi:hypothetical protein Tco_1020612 [Tanacetum coccineum]
MVVDVISTFPHRGIFVLFQDNDTSQSKQNLQSSSMDIHSQSDLTLYHAILVLLDSSPLRNGGFGDSDYRNSPYKESMKKSYQLLTSAIASPSSLHP